MALSDCSTQRCFTEVEDGATADTETQGPGWDCRNKIAEMSSPNENEDDWGEEDLDLEMRIIQLTQMAEEDLQRSLSQDKSNDDNSDGRPQMSLNQAKGLYDTRRAGLEPCDDDDPIMRTYNSGEDAKLQLHKIQGEVALLRSKYDKARNELQAYTLQKLDTENKMKQRYDNEIRELRKKLVQKETDIRQAKDEITRLKIPAFVPKKANGAFTSMSQTQKALSPGLAKALNGTISLSRNRSSPNLASSQTQQVLSQQWIPETPPDQGPFSQSPPLEGLAPVLSPPPQTESRPQSQSDFDDDEEDELEKFQEDELAFDDNRRKINVKGLHSVGSMQAGEYRKEIFSKLESLVEIEFKEVKPTLLFVAKAMPMKVVIMFLKRMKTKHEGKFPDVVDIMYNYGILLSKVKARKKRNIPSDLSRPPLPPVRIDPILDLQKAIDALREAFAEGGSAKALDELKTIFIWFLEKLTGNDRMKLFMIDNLYAMWTLLTWSKHLWKFVVFDEELPKLRNTHTREVWADKLKLWTGIILKADWRDLFIPELETVIRELTLHILESIVVAGYFEHAQRRYEILYSIIKDTLVKDHLRQVDMVNKCLAIVTWSIYDKSILHYLCFGKNKGNCLAQILADRVLECFEETRKTDQYKATQLVVSYLYMLETLMIEKPKNYHTSKVARKENKSLCESVSDPEDEAKKAPKPNPSRPAVNQSLSENVGILSQFADPNKYKFEQGSKARSYSFDRVKKVACWIKPTEWEITIENYEKNPCQCRKPFLGHVFSMLNSIVNMWSENYAQFQELLAEREESETIKYHKKLERPQEDPGEDDPSKKEEEGEEEDDDHSEVEDEYESPKEFIERVKSIREFVIKEFGNRNLEIDNDIIRERTWEQILDHFKNSTSDDKPEYDDWMEDKMKPSNMFDFILKQSLLLISFTQKYSNDMNESVGPLCYGDSIILLSQIRSYQEEIDLTDIDRSCLQDLDIKFPDSDRPFMKDYEISDDEDEEEDYKSTFLPEPDLETLLKDAEVQDPTDNESPSESCKKRLTTLKRRHNRTVLKMAKMFKEKKKNDANTNK